MSSIYFQDSEWEKNRLWPYYPPHLKVPILHPMQRQLDVVRAEYDAPMVITPNGGYRSPEHNRAQRGAKRSLHPEGKATDFRIKGLRRKWRFYRLVMRLWRERRIPDLSGVGVYWWGVHLDFFGPRRRNGKPRRWFRIRQRP